MMADQSSERTNGPGQRPQSFVKESREMDDLGIEYEQLKNGSPRGFRFLMVLIPRAPPCRAFDLA